MRKYILVFPFLILLAYTSCSAQSLSQILKRHEYAVGRKILNGARTVIIESEIMSGKMKIAVKVTYKRPRKIRSESRYKAAEYITASNGTRAWESDPSRDDGRPHILSSAENERLKSQSIFDGVLYRYKEKGSRVKLLGKEKLKDRLVFKLKLTKKDGEIEFIYIDAQTYLFSRTVTEIKHKGRKIERTADLSDYKDISGIKVPFRFEVNRDGRKTIQIVKNVLVNKKVPDSYFEFKNPAE